MQNITKFQKSREDVIKFHNEYFKVVHIAAYDLKDKKGLKILTPKSMLQILPTSLAQAKLGNTSKNVLNEIKQFIYSLYQAKQVAKRVYKNIVNSRKKVEKQLQSRMDTIFMNSKNYETSDPHRLFLNLTDKVHLKRSNKYVSLSILYTKNM